MALTQEIRATVRAAYQGRCGYCGISETWAGSELELDHFRPTAQGGSDALDNLVYACTTCNRFKSGYWPSADARESLRLLHPLHDDLSLHLQETADGQLMGLTSRGWFHIHRLHLNRPQLVEVRQFLQVNQPLQRALVQAQDVQAQLRTRIRDLEAEVAELQKLIALLTGAP